MLTIIIIILGISFLLYTLLGGADFGAGIIETFTGSKESKTVSKAMAPVWEANHVWLILAVVIMFTGFPKVYAAISLSLHIPLMVALMGIVLRGSAFIFRFYNVSDDGSMDKYFTVFFKLSSLITPVFLGIIFGAMTLGRVSLNNSGSFYEQFIFPWCNIFCFTFGLFLASLFAYIAAVFLIGETENKSEQKKYIRLSLTFLLLTFTLALFVFVTAELQNQHLFNKLFTHSLSTGAFGIAFLLIPAIIYLFRHPTIFYLRAAISLQVTLVLLGWFAMNFPVMLYEKNGNHLSFLNAHAPYATLYQLLIALLVGLVLIIPSFYFLFKVFKKTKGLQ